MTRRLANLEAFWPHYLREHKSSVSRRLHFVGTTGFLASAAASAALNPIGTLAALAGTVAIGRRGVKAEAEERSLKHVAGMVALPILASPVLFPAGAAFAYGCAWVGHYGFEKNRPATFEYPVMSLASDFKMWWQMAKGKLWSGDDPAADLGFLSDDAGSGAEVTPLEVAAAG